MLLETQQSMIYGRSWGWAGKIWMISNYKDTDISIRGMETFMVLVSGWLDCPVWVTLKRLQIRLQTISIPLDQGCNMGWQTAAASCPLRRQKCDQFEGRQGGEHQKTQGDTDGGDVRWMNGD